MTKPKSPEERKKYYPAVRKSSYKPPPKRYELDQHITTEFKKYAGQPNAARDKRTLVKKFNPLHYIFGTKL